MKLRLLPNGTRFRLERNQEKYLLLHQKMLKGRKVWVVKKDGAKKESTLSHQCEVKPLISPETIQQMEVYLPFEELLIQHGAKIEYPMDGGGMGYAATSHYKFRYTRESLEVGRRKNFDRWANSVDFILQKLPENEFEFSVMLKTLDQLVEKGITNEAWGDAIDIYPFMRKIRKEMKTVNRHSIPDMNNFA